MTNLRLAVIGGGHLGRIHAKLANSNEHFDLVAVADPSPDSRETVREQLGVPCVEDYKELIGSIDAAVVAAPTVHHYEITSTLLRAGVDCLVEKPLAHSADQADRLVQIAKSRGRILQVGHVERFNPAWTTVQPYVRQPKFIQAVRAGAYSGRSTDIGVVMDLMIHDLDLILSIEKSPLIGVQASGLAVLGSHEDIAEARLEFESGCIANIRASRLATEPTREMQVFSACGYADINFSSDEVKVVTPSEAVLLRSVGLDELPAAERMEKKERIFDDFLNCQTLNAPKRNAILDEQNDFAISIQTKADPAVSGDDGARAVSAATRILAAVAEHRWDGSQSKPWRVGALASQTPSILPLSPVADEHTQREHRRAG